MPKPVDVLRFIGGQPRNDLRRDPFSQNIQACLFTRSYDPVIASSSACILPYNDRYSLSGWEPEIKGKKRMRWKQLLAYITGSADQELLRNEYLVTENHRLHQQIRGRVRLSDSDRKILAAMGKKLGKQALEEIAIIVKPDTILAWHRKLVAQKFDGSPRVRTMWC